MKNFDEFDYEFGNTGVGNTGNSNTGDWNIGNSNAGDCNTGNWNTGNSNAGDWNTGNWNTGDGNTGDWNKSSFNTGCFNTIEQKIMLFNKPSDMTYRDWYASDARRLLNQMPTCEMTGRRVKPEHCQIWWDKLSDHQKDIIKAIPNFDDEIFFQCTGIKVDG